MIVTEDAKDIHGLSLILISKWEFFARYKSVCATLNRLPG